MLLNIAFLSLFLTDFILLFIFSIDFAFSRHQSECSFLWVHMSDISQSFALMPWFVTGFADGEGTFVVSIFRSKTHSLGWTVLLIFEVSAANNPANRQLLESFRDFFGGGQINSYRNQLYYRVQDLPTLLKVRDHFLKHPLQSTKLIYFQLWSQVLDLMVIKEHLVLEGLLRIIAIKSHFPRGLNSKLIAAFPNIPSI